MSKNFRDFTLYFIVGGVATITEWIVFFILDSKMNCHYLLATAIAYIISTFVNWAVGRLLVFKTTNQPLWKEITSIYVASIIGLMMNMAIMWFAVEVLSIIEMISKVIATCIVFLWNFIIRKLVIYKE